MMIFNYVRRSIWLVYIKVPDGYPRQSCDIYDGTGIFSSVIGSYKNGVVYEGVGWGKHQIGSYRNGTIYSGVGIFGETAIGEYDGPDDGAAAAALLLLLREKVDE